MTAGLRCRGAVAGTAICALVAVGGPGAGPAQGSAARVFRVTTVGDGRDLRPGDGRCRTEAGQCSLRAAVMEANATRAADVIVVPRGRYRLKRTGHDDMARSGDLDIVRNLTIRGAGRAKTVIDGNGIDRVFELDFDGTATFSRLTIRGGRAETGAGVDAKQSHLVLRRVVIRDNHAGSRGGGIYYGSVRMFRSALVGNTAGGRGGGIFGSDARLLRSIVRGNRARWGGGIATSGDVVAGSSTFAGNRAVVDGGGLRIQHKGSATIRFSSLYGNDAGGDGGALWVTGDSARAPAAVNLSNSTVSRNAAGGRGGGIFIGIESAVRQWWVTLRYNSAAQGGHVYNIGTGTTTASIFADVSGGGHCAGTPLVSGGDNLQDSDGGGCGLDETSGDLVGDEYDPQLKPLAFNGGPTKNHALPPSSPAVDAAPAEVGEDQRHVSRPQGAACDIGSFELRASA